jgi:hypothetical protein
MNEDEKSDVRDAYAGRERGASREKHRHH